MILIDNESKELSKYVSENLSKVEVVKLFGEYKALLEEGKNLTTM